ncbi:MAG: PEP-CTERM sorting domain-containing protein [Fimbriimonadaceae bacterium]|nr:PEP-CTERM sorting domain-containing protein [Chthonomonadaceae bacterium]MCO5295261.1 PEP-CTERM sorting domain-containing protein [Fimbriimonadaceae bacterium]
MNLRTMLVLSVVAASGAVHAEFHLAGDFNGWDPNGPLLNETGSGTGIFTADLSGLGDTVRHEFKVTDGTWNVSWPGSGNSWFYSTSGGEITITYDTNVYGDGWSGDGGRIGLSNNVSAWTAVGDWQGWDNANAATAMADMGGGIYKFTATGLSAGSHFYKAVNTGTWDAIGADYRSINADNLEFFTDAANPNVELFVNVQDGTIRANPVPEPASMVALALGAGALLARRRRA